MAAQKLYGSFMPKDVVYSGLFKGDDSAANNSGWQNFVDSVGRYALGKQYDQTKQGGMVQMIRIPDGLRGSTDMLNPAEWSSSTVPLLKAVYALAGHDPTTGNLLPYFNTVVGDQERFWKTIETMNPAQGFAAASKALRLLAPRAAEEQFNAGIDPTQKKLMYELAYGKDNGVQKMADDQENFKKAFNYSTGGLGRVDSASITFMMKQQAIVAQMNQIMREYKGRVAKGKEGAAPSDVARITSAMQYLGKNLQYNAKLYDVINQAKGLAGKSLDAEGKAYAAQIANEANETKTIPSEADDNAAENGMDPYHEPDSPPPDREPQSVGRSPASDNVVDFNKLTNYVPAYKISADSHDNLKWTPTNDPRNPQEKLDAPDPNELEANKKYYGNLFHQLKGVVGPEQAIQLVSKLFENEQNNKKMQAQGENPTSAQLQKQLLSPEEQAKPGIDEELMQGHPEGRYANSPPGRMPASEEEGKPGDMQRMLPFGENSGSGGGGRAKPQTKAPSEGSFFTVGGKTY